jgi:hypothetical protein
MKHPVEAKFRPGEAVADMDTAERGEVIAVVLHEAYEQQVEETMETLAEGPENFYR